MSTVAAPVRSANRPAGPARSAGSPAQLSAALWAALRAAASLEGDRFGLPDYSSFKVDLCVTGTIDGQPVEKWIVGNLNVGHLLEEAGDVASVESANAMLAKIRNARRSPGGDGVKFDYVLPAV
ncbi:MAG TPA: hypothetical protein VG713_03985 [Pirellulales bacterium]|nr:hypothetical protein [Pirellulales bacterium]